MIYSRVSLTQQCSLQMVHALEDAHSGQSVRVLEQYLLEHNFFAGRLDEEGREQDEGEQGEQTQLEQHQTTPEGGGK